MMRSWFFSGLLLHAATAIAADANGEFALKGAGFLTCKAYAEERARRSDVYYMIGGWLDGFISAHNKYAHDTYDVTSFESAELLLRVIDGHCKANPDDRLYSVINSLVTQLGHERLQEKSVRVEIVEGRRKAVLYRETIGRIQTKLTQLGLYKAPVDSAYTDATRSALMAFQSDIGFEMTGFPDQATLWHLLRN